MSTLDINKVENEEENKSPDKKQIEAEEKEVMLKTDVENIEAPAESKTDAEGPVKSALSGDVTEQGREVKPKFIPIGAIKMPGFFTRNSDKDKSKQDDESGIEKDCENEKADDKPKRRRFQFLHTCPFTQFMHHPQHENADNSKSERKTLFGSINVKYPKFFQRQSSKDPEATLASMETLEDKLDTPNDGMENVKLDTGEEDGKVATKLPLKERIRQRKFIIDDIIVVGVVVLVLLAAIIGIVIGACAGPPAERPLRLGRYMTTITGCGKVEGVLDEGVYKFYSIPYAVPPLGENRFAHAKPLNNISLCGNDTLEVHTPGPLCLQFLENGTIVGDEDCLTLDIVTPHVRYDTPLPVVILIGANSLAGGISPAQPSALYSRTKEVVFVRPNFRLGPFGFLALDILSETNYPATSGNYGLSDLYTVLEWVNYNIKHFGGDPNSVTLVGHRAGATLVAALSTVKKAQKLYSRAWLSSPSLVFPTEPLEQALKDNDKFKQFSQCKDAACLRRISAAEILATTPDVWLSNDVGTLPTADEAPKHSWLVMDGIYLRMPVNESWIEQKKAKESGKSNVFKPMVFGTTQHSGHSELLRNLHRNWTSELVEQLVSESPIAAGNASALFTVFNKTYDGLSELIGSVRTLCPLVNLTQGALGAPLYVVAGSGAGGGAGAGLAGINADIEAILGTFDSEVPEQRRFMAAMQLLFYYYVWHGNLPGPDSAMIAVGQDLLPLKDLPTCRLLIDKGLVPKYAHVD